MRASTLFITPLYGSTHYELGEVGYDMIVKLNIG